MADNTHNHFENVTVILAINVQTGEDQQVKQYMLVKQNKDWNAAESYCRSNYEQGSLVAIRDEREQLALSSYLHIVAGQSLQANNVIVIRNCPLSYILSKTGPIESLQYNLSPETTPDVATIELEN